MWYNKNIQWHINEEKIFIPQIQKRCAEREKIMKKDVDVKRENEEIAKVTEKLREKAIEAAEKAVAVLDGKSTAMKIAMKIAMVFLGILSCVSLCWCLKVSIMFFYYTWEYMGMKQVAIISFAIAIAVDEVQKHGFLSLLVKVAAIILVIKVAGDLTDVDTTSIDVILRWIANIPEFVTRELTPLFRFKFW